MSGCLVAIVRTCSHPQNPWEKHTFLCLPFKGLPESSCTGERAARQRCLFWFPREIRLITPAARSRIWGQAKTSNKNLWLQEIWKAAAASDSCPSKLDCVLRGDCTHQQSELWWACQMTLIADRRIECFHRQKWRPHPPPQPPHTHPTSSLDPANNEVRNHEERPATAQKWDQIVSNVLIGWGLASCQLCLKKKKKTGWVDSSVSKVT